MSGIKLTFPGGLITKTQIQDYTVITDYPEEYGGSDVAMNPWFIFLSAIISCHGVNIAKYCMAYGLDHSQIVVELFPMMEDALSDPHPEYVISIQLPDDFPSEHRAGLIEFCTNCPVAKQLTQLEPVVSTYLDGKLVSRMERQASVEASQAS